MVDFLLLATLPPLDRERLERLGRVPLQQRPSHDPQPGEVWARLPRGRRDPLPQKLGRQSRFEHR